MKSIRSTIVRTLIAAVLVTGIAGLASAHYDHDSKGWFDEHHHHHSFVKDSHGHRGYWDKDDKGAKVFIRI